MKTIDYYMDLPYRLEIVPDSAEGGYVAAYPEYMSLPYRLEIVPDSAEGGYVAAYPELPGCITVGNTLEETVAHVLDAKREWLTAALEDGIEIKEPVSLQSILRRKGSV